MKKTRIRSRLYVETLRRLLVPGILLTAFLIITYFVSFTDNVHTTAFDGQTGEPIGREVFGYEDFSWIICSISSFAGPLLVYSAFSFLRSKSQTDFYHSLAVTRRRMFFELYAAAMTWFAVVVCFSEGVGIILFATRPDAFLLLYKDILAGTLSSLFYACLGGAVMAIVCSLTGRAFTCLVGYASLRSIGVMMLFETFYHLNEYSGSATEKVTMKFRECVGG